MPDFFGLVLIIAGLLVIIFSSRIGKDKAKEQRRLMAKLFGFKTIRHYRESSYSAGYYHVSYILVGLLFVLFGVLRLLNTDFRNMTEFLR